MPSKNLIDYTLHLADNALILGHRNSEWCGHGPVLEQDIAITNISLDLIGQARNFYQYAAELINQTYQSEDSKVPPSEGFREVSEDSLAYLRDPHEFKNCLLVELPKGDWAITILRQFFFSTYQFFLYQRLQESNPDSYRDEQLAAIAVKSLKEVVYHLRWSSEWVIRLGDGTDESRDRIMKAIDELWPYTEELFLPASYEKQINIDFSQIKNEWHQKVNTVFNEAGLIPSSRGEGAIFHTGGKEGKHTAHLDDIFADLQYMQRTYPNSEW